MLGTGRLTLARAIGLICFLDEVLEVELRKFSEKKKKKKNNVGIRTHARSIDGPMQLPLAHRDTTAEFCLMHSFIIQLFLAFPVS